MQNQIVSEPNRGIPDPLVLLMSITLNIAYKYRYHFESLLRNDPIRDPIKGLWTRAQTV